MELELDSSVRDGFLGGWKLTHPSWYQKESKSNDIKGDVRRDMAEAGQGGIG